MIRLIILVLLLSRECVASVKISSNLSNVHFVSRLLDLKNDSLRIDILVPNRLHPTLNVSFCEHALNIVHSGRFRPFHYPSHWDRYDTHWYSLSRPHLLTLKQSKFRVLLSSVRSQVGDGLGHMWYLSNFELNLAIRLRVSFSFRHSLYQSLTKNDPFAVDDFFGWGRKELPREKLWAECALSHSFGEASNIAHRCTSCESVPGDGPLGFQRVVPLPSFLVYNCTSRRGWDTKCDDLAHKVLQKHNLSHTIFQIPPGKCGYEGTNTNMTETGSWYYHKYWQQHGRQFRAPWRRRNPAILKRSICFDPKKLNIAVHIRRGDFFKESKRRMLPDRVYARAVCDVLDIVDTMDGVFARTDPVIHIYSQGKQIPESTLTTHDIDGMDNVYYDENQIERDSRHWESFIKAMKSSDHRLKQDLRGRVKVSLHVSEDTLTSMHEMVAADIFIGSDSSMSLGPIYTLSRGVRLVVTPSLRPKDWLHAQFDPESGCVLTAGKFIRAWTVYEAANSHSLMKHFKGSRF